MKPKFAIYYKKKNKVELAEIVTQSSKLIFWLSIPVVLIIFFIPGILLSIFDKSLTSSVNVLSILNIGQLVNISCGSVAVLLKMTEHEHIVKNVLGGVLLLNIVLNLILIKLFGEAGAAISSSLSIILWNILLCIIAWKKLGLKVFYLPTQIFSK